VLQQRPRRREERRREGRRVIRARSRQGRRDGDVQRGTVNGIGVRKNEEKAVMW
jgi:hypothetical protein